MNDPDVARQVVGVLIVFCLLGVFVFALGRWRGTQWFRLPQLRRPRSDMEVLDRLYLTPQHSLQVVRVGTRSMLISIHPGGCTLLESGPLEHFGQQRGAG